jgi:hypothetical protein
MGSARDCLAEPWLVDSVSWRAPRAEDRYAGHNELNMSQRAAQR